MTAYGAEKKVSGFCLGKTIAGETRWGWQTWIVKYYERLDGFDHRLLDWYDYAWA